MEVIKSPQRIHPLVATAAVALTLVSLVGVAAITGLLPTSHSEIAPQQLASNSTASPANAAAPTANPASVSTAQAAGNAPGQAASAAGNNSTPVPAVAEICHSCGQVEAIRTVQHTPKASGVGIVAGAVLGGILGNQIGAGNGRTLATVAGAGAGGYAGNEVEKRSRTTTSYVVDVRMENGKIRSFPQSGEGWRVGDQVRVVNGHLTSRG